MSQPTTITRRQLFAQAAFAAAVLTPVGWLAPRQAGAASAQAARPAPAIDFDAAVATAWFDELLALIQATPGYSPPVAARAVGYAGVTLYEAIVAGMPEHHSMGGLLADLRALPGHGRSAAYHWPTAANAALAELLRALFPGAPAHRRQAVERLEASVVVVAPRSSRGRSIDHGRAIARAVYAWSATDGGHEGYLHNFPGGYLPPVGPGLWEPTAPGFLPALQPLWGTNRNFLPAGGACDPGPPPAYSTDPASACFGEALEVYTTVNALSDEQLAIALFWSDDPGNTATPPGHSISILTQMLRTRGASLADAGEAYARLGIALSDAFVACWRVKYAHNLLRPITYIRATIDPAWGDPLPLVTPPFPEYTSGHSVQSAAAAAVLTAQLGEMAFVDHTHDSRGLVPRSFASFEAAAAEAAISRLYGGIHFRAAIDRGLSQGRCIGKRVAALPLRG
jgi:hypothetical protein